MIMSASLLTIFIAGHLLASSPVAETTQSNKHQVEQFFQRPGVSAAEVLEARGYIGQRYHFITDDGYVLSMTRAINPLISDDDRRRGPAKKKRPILFVHGFSTDSTLFLANSFGAEARDLSHLNLADMSLEEAQELLADDETSHSLPMLALNLGHEVWLLHRRGTQLSRKQIDHLEWDRPETPHEKLIRARKFVKNNLRNVKTNKENLKLKVNHHSKLAGTHLTDLQRVIIDRTDDRPLLDKIHSRFQDKKRHSKLKPALAAASSAIFNYFKLFDDIKLTFDQRFWNYSMDEQAAYDIPNAIEAIRQVSGHDKVIMFGDSSGGGIVLMSLILNPELNSKLAKVVAWAPAFVMGHAESAANFDWTIPVLQAYNGPFPWPFLTHPIEAMLQVFCGLEFMQRTLCQLLENIGRGRSHGQSPIRPEFVSNILVPVSSKEAAHMLQLAQKGRPKMYDFGSAKKNLEAYGQFETPFYDPSLITFDKVSIWASTTDTLVSPNDINLLVNSLRVPHKLFVIDQPGLAFNHGSLSFHVDINKLAVIPTLRDMEETNIEFD